ncbi:MAG: C40 family peptidase [Paludibacteraceae bacterium]|nr:C40 family peptidase [Paludibacteraceae bacterium]
MQKAISLHSIVPVRAEARESAEQLTQMLFGELCTVLEQKMSPEGDRVQWFRIRLDNDGQTGWADAKMIAPIAGKDYSGYRRALKCAARVAMPVTYAVSDNNGQTIPLAAGTTLTNYSNGHFQILGVGFRIDPAMVAEQPVEMTPDNLLRTVRFFLNVPYLWGGKNAMGMDCSGFTQVVMSLFGKQLPRNAGEQVRCGRNVPSLLRAKPGDLLFFDHNDGKISHVGILLTSQKSEASLIHCSGRVKVEKIDSTGIFSVERADPDHPQGVYTHHLVAIRRL